MAHLSNIKIGPLLSLNRDTWVSLTELGSILLEFETKRHLSLVVVPMNSVINCFFVFVAYLNGKKNIQNQPSIGLIIKYQHLANV